MVQRQGVQHLWRRGECVGPGIGAEEEAETGLFGELGEEVPEFDLELLGSSLPVQLRPESVFMMAMTRRCRHGWRWLAAGAGHRRIGAS
jgi:hypothetical protein